MTYYHLSLTAVVQIFQKLHIMDYYTTKKHFINRLPGGLLQSAVRDTFTECKLAI